MRDNLLKGLKAIEHFASLRPNSPALLSPDQNILTYNDLWQRITAVRGRLNEAGIGAEETVAVLAPQGPIQIIAVAGALSYCACAPLQPRTVFDEVLASLRSLSASALIVSSEFAAEAKAASEMGLVVVYALSDLFPKEWHVVQSANRLKPSSSNSDAVLYPMTSATTGASRIVPLSVANLDARASARVKSLRLAASDRQLLMMSLCHALGVENTLAQFQAGGSVVVTGGFDPTAYRRWLEDLRPTWYDCAPAVHEAALAELKDAPPQLATSLRFIQSAGAALPPATKTALQSILKIPVFNDYGITETGPIATDAFVEVSPPDGAAGRACGPEVAVMATSGELLSAAEEGEIAVRGTAVFSGYLDDPQATHAAFRDGWFRTGDAGHLDENGNLYITGRLKEMINRGGEKISPAEVDGVFRSHPAVMEAAAFPVPHPTLGEDVACAVVLREGSESLVSSRELLSFAGQHLAPFKVPHRIHFVDKIPRGELGKPQRWLLTERLADKRAGPPAPAEVTELMTANDVVINLHEIWARILDREDLGFDEDFFEAGGDSLAAVNMLAEVDQRFGCQTGLVAASFLDEPTLLHLAGLVGKPSPPRPSRSDSSDMLIFPVHDMGCSVRMFCVPTDGEEGLYFRRLATHLSGQMDVSIVRPANTWYSRSLFTFEHAGAEAAALIRQAQSQGPYFVSGYCYGGVVASEVARHLSLMGQDVWVILFDTPMPGLPSLLRERWIWMEGAKRQWRRLTTSKHPGLTKNLHKFSRLLLWSAVVPFRRFLVPFERVGVVQRLVKWAHISYFPFYKPRPVDASLLHILSADEPTSIDAFDADCRLRWRSSVRGGIEERLVAHDHYNVLHESNLPEITNVLIRWCSALNDGAHRQS